MNISKVLKELNKFEWSLWLISVAIVVVSFLIAGSADWLTLVAPVVGVTSLIFLAKGQPIGNVLMIVFSGIYGYISFELKYYGEVITYVGMTLPMAIMALVSWTKNPFKKGKSQVAVARIKSQQLSAMILITVVVTIAFYFILKSLGTSNLIVSTVSVTTSFVAAYLTFLRSSYYALGYALNDVVLVVLWISATFKDVSSLPVAVCFVVFFVNDIYGFYSWRKMEIKQGL